MYYRQVDAKIGVPKHLYKDRFKFRESKIVSLKFLNLKYKDRLGHQQ